MKINKLLLGVVVLALAACGQVPVGSVGIKVSTLGSDKGVNQEVLGPGYYWMGMFHNLYSFPTYMQTRKWEGNEAFTFQTIDGMVVTAPLALSYAVEPDKVPELFQTYRKGLDEITEIYIHNIIRDAVQISGSTRTVDDVYGAGKAKLLADIQRMAEAKLGPMGIKVDQVSLVGQFELPENVVDSINNKIQATQKAQQRENEVATAKAQAQIAVAQAQGEADARILQATAEAKANQLLSQSLTPTLVELKAIEKWKGEVPTYSGSGATPFININK